MGVCACLPACLPARWPRQIEELRKSIKELKRTRVQKEKLFDKEKAEFRRELDLRLQEIERLKRNSEKARVKMQVSLRRGGGGGPNHGRTGWHTARTARNLSRAPVPALCCACQGCGLQIHANQRVVVASQVCAGGAAYRWC